MSRSSWEKLKTLTSFIISSCIALKPACLCLGNCSLGNFDLQSVWSDRGYILLSNWSRPLNWWWCLSSWAIIIIPNTNTNTSTITFIQLRSIRLLRLILRNDRSSTLQRSRRCCWKSFILFITTTIILIQFIFVFLSILSCCSIAILPHIKPKFMSRLILDPSRAADVNITY